MCIFKSVVAAADLNATMVYVNDRVLGVHLRPPASEGRIQHDQGVAEKEHVGIHAADSGVDAPQNGHDSPALGVPKHA